MGSRPFLVIAALVAVLAPAGRAGAHAGLASSSPADGATLAESVGSVKLTFTESVQPSAEGYTVTLDGTELPAEADTADGAAWTLTFEPVHGGAVTVAYDVVSADGHVIAGALTFTVAATPTSAPPQPAAPTQPVPTQPAPSAPPAGPATSIAGSSTTAGPPTGAPTASPAPTTSPDPDGDSPSPLVWVLVALGGAGLLGAAAWSAARRRVT